MIIGEDMIQHQRPSAYPFDIFLHIPISFSIPCSWWSYFPLLYAICMPKLLIWIHMNLADKRFRNLSSNHHLIAHPWDLCSQVSCGLPQASRTCKQWFVSSCSASSYNYHGQYWSILDQRDGFGSTVQQVALDHSILKPCIILDPFWSFLIHIHMQSLTARCGPPKSTEISRAEELVLSRAEDETEILRSQNKELKEVPNESKRWNRDPIGCLMFDSVLYDLWYWLGMMVEKDDGLWWTGIASMVKNDS